MEAVFERSMTLVRRALIKATDAGADAEQILLDDDYNEPRALVPPLHVITGQLARKDSTQPVPADLPRLELDYPRPEMIVREVPSGRIDHTFNADVKALYVPANVEIRNIRPGLRAAHVKPPPDDTDADDPSA